MAVVLVTSPQRYLGLSGDTKPGAAAGVRAGAQFYETDTLASYVYDGAAWQLKPRGDE